MLNSGDGCWISLSADLLSAFPTLPKAFFISASKFPCTSFFSFAKGGVGSGGDLRSSSFAESDAIAVTVCKVPTIVCGRCASDKSSAGGRDFISFARAKEISGTVDDEMTGAKISKALKSLGPFVSSPMLAFMNASTHPRKSTSFSALKMWIF